MLVKMICNNRTTSFSNTHYLGTHFHIQHSHYAFKTISIEKDKVRKFGVSDTTEALGRKWKLAAC